MDKDSLFFEIVIFIAAALVIGDVAPRFNGFFGGIITGITLVRILNIVSIRKTADKGE